MSIFADFLKSFQILQQVSLVSFTASKSTTAPFGDSSLLTWEVQGPRGEFGVELRSWAEGEFFRQSYLVSPTGTLSVEPRNDTIYALYATSGPASKKLAEIKIHVDLSSCEVGEFGILRPIVTSVLRRAVEDSGDLYFRVVPTGGFPPQFKQGGPVVAFQSNRIEFKLWLGAEVDKFPNPSVDIRASFGFGVDGDGFVISNESVSADVRVPWYVWAIPGAIVALPILLGNAEARARNEVRAGIQEFAVLPRLALPAGRRPHAVWIANGENDEGYVRVRHCSGQLP